MKIIDQWDVALADGAFASLRSGGLRLSPGETIRVKEAAVKNAVK